ncbi:MAG: class I SAM-dependent methyltransferase [Solirubrobacteraceae bacterium]
MPSSPAPLPSSAAKEHWEAVYKTNGAREVSWYQPEPEISLALIAELGLARDAAIVDVGAGTSNLAERLLAEGFADITVLDLSPRALELARAELGANAARVQWVEQDLLNWSPQRQYDLWHDRAVFHFLLDPAQQERYAETLRSAIHPGGKVVIGTFAADGPTTCSGLPVAQYDAERLANVVGESFTTLTTRREEHRTPADSIQPFMWFALERGP